MTFLITVCNFKQTIRDDVFPDEELPFPICRKTDVDCCGEEKCIDFQTYYETYMSRRGYKH